MRLHRFIYPCDLSKKNITISDPHVIRQITKVLRLRAGDELIISDGAGRQARCRITKSEPKLMTAEILELIDAQDKSTSTVDIYCAILKKENFEFVVQKATEIGVCSITPIKTEHTVKTAINDARLKTIAREAAEQSGQTTVAAIHPTQEYRAALQGALANHQKIFFCDLPQGEAEKETITTDEAGEVAVFIGPEGGWSQSEREYIHDLARANPQNIRIVHLGDTTLRAETAAIIASYLAVQGNMEKRR